MKPTEHSDAHWMTVLESRFGMRVSAWLSTGAEGLPHDITERLRHARKLALERRQLASLVQVNGAAIGLTPAAALSFGGDAKGPSQWTSLSALVPLVALLLGLGLIEHFNVQDQISAAAEVDAALLSDDLPPAAYSDPGFVEYLKSSHE